MKKIAIILSGILTCAALTAAPKILVVDMQQAYSKYYKAKEAAAQINASIETTKAELTKMGKQREDLIKEIQAVQEKLNNPALSEDAKKQIMESEAQPKLMEARQIEVNMQNINEQATQRLQQNAQSIRQVHMQEIKAIIEKLAKEKKADFILEKAVCYFAEPESDVTEDLIKMINADDPANK